MKKILLPILSFIILTSSAFSQSRTFDPANARDGETVEYCLIHKKQAELLLNPAAVLSFAQDELIRQQEAQNPVVEPKGTVYKIPIVFHVLHNGGVENISDEQILDALFILNRDYRLQNADAAAVHPDFTGLPADVEIEFVLATKAPNGTCFSGITRTQHALSYDGSDGDDQVDAIVAGNDVYNGQWAGNKYCNIFICGDIGGAAGYTNYPSSWGGTGMKNGIWVLHNYVGSIGTSSTGTSRTLTHETGHWLNLPHVWGSTNNPGLASNCSSDDGVADTPNEIGVTSCNVNEMSCGPRANVENYMDYSYCSKMFTPGQVTRMRTALNSGTGGRSNLKTAANLLATGADGNLYLCKADFTADKTTICAGDQIQFTDESYNVVNGWTWTFTGGTPSSSSSQNPIITYNSPGLYEVTLAATDGTTNDSEVKTSYIRVHPASATVPFLEDFEGYSTLSNIQEWEIINTNNDAAWVLETTTGHTGTKSAKLLNNNQPVGSLDELVSAPVDLSAVSSVTLSFRYAYKRKNSGDDDWFRVYATSDCGDSWAIRKTIHGAQISSAVQSSAFVPASQSDWTTVHMTNITSNYWVDNFRYKFAFEAGGGNNFYLDNINIYEGAPSENLVVGISENEIVNDLRVYPNPVDDELNISFGVNSAQDVTIQIQDLMGKVTQRNFIQANEGSNLVFVNTSELAAGLYFLQIQVGGAYKTIQFVVK